MQLTMILNILGYDLTVALGTDVSKEAKPEDDAKELIVVESSGEVERATIGFRPNDDEESEDRYGTR
jgi:hypothetical protein